MERREKRILVVDDDDAIRTLLFTVLRRRGFTVDRARNGAEAMERCGTCRYALVLLDLMMPRMSGYEFLDRIEHDWQGDKPMVFVLTAGTEPRNLNPTIVAGSMRKPFDIELLLDAVTACLSTVPEQLQSESCSNPDSDGVESPQSDAN